MKKKIDTITKILEMLSELPDGDCLSVLDSARTFLGHGVFRPSAYPLKEQIMGPGRVIGMQLAGADEEEVRLAQLVVDFAGAMHEKLLAKKREGYRGWNDDSKRGLEKDFWERMNEHVARWHKDPRDLSNIIDTANFLAFIWNLRRK